MLSFQCTVHPANVCVDIRHRTHTVVQFVNTTYYNIIEVIKKLKIK